MGKSNCSKRWMYDISCSSVVIHHHLQGHSYSSSYLLLYYLLLFFPPASFRPDCRLVSVRAVGHIGKCFAPRPNNRFWYSPHGWLIPILYSWLPRAIKQTFLNMYNICATWFKCNVLEKQVVPPHPGELLQSLVNFKRFVNRANSANTCWKPFRTYTI